MPSILPFINMGGNMIVNRWNSLHSVAGCSLNTNTARCQQSIARMREKLLGEKERKK